MAANKHIKIQLSDGHSSDFPAGITPKDILLKTQPNQLHRILAARLNEKLVDLGQPLNENGILKFIAVEEPEALDIFWHSTSHIMAQAVKRLYPDAQLGIGPAVAKGFYYDFKLDQPITPDDLPCIEEVMKKIVEENLIFEREVLTQEDAVQLFKQLNESFKVELIQELADTEITVYRNAEFIDLCRGPHIPSTKFAKYFKLTSVAGAYWHGDERNAVMQRIYGISFSDKNE